MREPEVVAAGPKFGVFPLNGETPSAGPTHHGPPEGALHDSPEEGPSRAGGGEVGVQHGDSLPDRSGSRAAVGEEETTRFRAIPVANGPRIRPQRPPNRLHPTPIPRRIRLPPPRPGSLRSPRRGGGRPPSPRCRPAHARRPAHPAPPLPLAPLPRNGHRPRTRSVATARSHLDCRNVLILIVAGHPDRVGILRSSKGIRSLSLRQREEDPQVSQAARLDSQEQRRSPTRPERSVTAAPVAVAPRQPLDIVGTTAQPDGRRRLRNALRAVFETEPFEDGKGHPANRVIAAAMDSGGHGTDLEWITRICRDSSADPAFSVAVVLCVARQPEFTSIRLSISRT